MAKFSYDDIVRVRHDADMRFRPGAIAWITGVYAKRPHGEHFKKFSSGTIYMIEYEDGTAIDIHESDLEAAAHC